MQRYRHRYLCLSRQECGDRTLDELLPKRSRTGAQRNESLQFSYLLLIGVSAPSQVRSTKCTQRSDSVGAIHNPIGGHCRSSYNRYKSRLKLEKASIVYSYTYHCTIHTPPCSMCTLNITFCIRVRTSDVRARQCGQKSESWRIILKLKSPTVLADINPSSVSFATNSIRASYFCAT